MYTQSPKDSELVDPVLGLSGTLKYKPGACLLSLLLGILLVTGDITPSLKELNAGETARRRAVSLPKPSTGSTHSESFGDWIYPSQNSDPKGSKGKLPETTKPREAAAKKVQTSGSFQTNECT
jgi:hypothetical protein